MTMSPEREEPLPERLPERPSQLREKARRHRERAMAEQNPENRRTFVMLAMEYDRLADAVEASNASAGDD